MASVLRTTLPVTSFPQVHGTARSIRAEITAKFGLNVTVFAENTVSAIVVVRINWVYSLQKKIISMKAKIQNYLHHSKLILRPCRPRLYTVTILGKSDDSDVAQLKRSRAVISIYLRAKTVDFMPTRNDSTNKTMAEPESGPATINCQHNSISQRAAGHPSLRHQELRGARQFHRNFDTMTVMLQGENRLHYSFKADPAPG